MPQPPTKLSILLGLMAEDKWSDALRMASKFGRLGDEKADITRAAEALARPEFYRAIKKDPDALIAAGIVALKTKYLRPSNPPRLAE